MLAVWLVVLMVDALAALGTALVATPDSGKQARATRAPGAHPATQLPHTHRRMQYEPRGFYILFARRTVYIGQRGRAKPSFYCRR